MTRYRLIALDLDGTLLPPDGRVTSRTRNAVRELVRRGVYVCYATGRNFTESKAVLEQVGHFPNAVFAGGASVVDTATGKVRRSVTMHAQLAREISAVFEGMGQAVLALQETDRVGFDYLITDGIPLGTQTTKWMALTKASVRRQTSLATHDHAHTLRVGIVAPPAECEAAMNAIRAQFGDGVVMHSIAVPPQGVEVVEVFDPTVSKWEGIRFIADERGVGGHEIVTVGDDINDLPMLRQAGLGVAMGNAHPEAKRQAKRTIKPQSEEGLAEFLESLIAEDRIAPA